MDVLIADITIPPGRRLVKDTTVRSLCESIAQVGLLQPILVTPDLRLVAGAHRIAACKLLGHETIRSETVDLGDLDRELAEIDENLATSWSGSNPIIEGGSTRRPRLVAIFMAASCAFSLPAMAAPRYMWRTCSEGKPSSCCTDASRPW